MVIVTFAEPSILAEPATSPLRVTVLAAAHLVALKTFLEASAVLSTKPNPTSLLVSTTFPVLPATVDTASVLSTLSKAEPFHTAQSPTS